ncbi:hypothetical protein B296_00008491 [Ensete ventricosum]|uniref:Uncharacterized protein n=1 Tax=Ensete ventricosum TaxID=4639 RepID=A0A426ZXT2_ENSVE|nr:hypothetical protein B296_00008491 [Ensete ventricosum]
MTSELTRSSSSSSRWSWTGGYQDPADVFRQRSIAAEEGDEQESLMWAALEKLPTYDRMRKGIIRQTVDGEGAVCSEVDIHRLRRQDRKLLLDRIFRVVEEDNERFLRRLRDRMDRFISSLSLPPPPHPTTRVLFFLNSRFCSRIGNILQFNWTNFMISMTAWNRVGLELPKIEVRYENVSVEAEVYVGSRALPTLWNATLNVLEVLSFHLLFVKSE